MQRSLEPVGGTPPSSPVYRLPPRQREQGGKAPIRLGCWAVLACCSPPHQLHAPHLTGIS